MSTCTFSPTYGPATPCNGWGVCVNTTDNPRFPQLCRCDWTVTIPSDVFEMRVDPKDHTLAMDCSTSRTAIMVLAVILLTSVMVRIVFNVKTVHHKISTGRLPKTISQLFNEPPNRILLLDMFFNTPCLISWPLLKVTLDQVVATDVAITVLIPLSILGITIAHGDLQHQLFSALIRGTFKTPMNSRLLRIHALLQIGVSFSYGFLAVIPTIVTLSFDKSLGPYENGLLTVLIIRNIGLIMWQTMALSTAFITTREVQKLIQEIGNVQGSDTAAVLKFVKENERSIAKKNFIALIAYIVFSLPWLWPQQGIQMLLMAFLASIGMMPGRVLYGTLTAAASSSARTRDVNVGDKSTLGVIPGGYSTTGAGSTAAGGIVVSTVGTGEGV